MKAKVLKEFKDKYTGKMYKKDDTITISKDRYNEICRKGELVKEIKDAVKATKKTAE